MRRETISPNVPTSAVLIGWEVDFESPFLFLESKVAKTNSKQHPKSNIPVVMSLYGKPLK
jgi:hypothetical protein